MVKSVGNLEAVVEDIMALHRSLPPRPKRGGSGCSTLSDRECGRYTVHTFAEFVEASEASGCS
ncbi:hypothetical protein KI387_042068 [Taxus chinensis]|uniref:Uncharacterized protein n=1 Tax=Taxus chinensis TaxID=29808 RepID=A0AA38C1A9_TAXCH|nr:hypothetical protein KI387_042068 [Taxus chinensis]